MIIKKTIRDFSILIALVLVWIFFGLVSPAFLSARNLSMLAKEFSIIAVLALGMLIIILPGNIDLSVGSGLGLIGGIASVLVFNYNYNCFIAMFIAMIIGIIIWFLMGYIIAKEKVPAFIITLGGLLVFKGLFWLIINNSTIPVVQGGKVNFYSIITTYYIAPNIGYILALFIIIVFSAIKIFNRIKRKQYGFTVENIELFFLKLFITSQMILLFFIIMNQFQGVPFSFLILTVIAISIFIITKHTRFGRYLYAIGGNEDAAIIAGIDVNKVIIGSFCIMGVIVSITGFMQAAYTGASTTTTGNLMELDAIAACVIGGTSLKGGTGTVLGVLFGALLMTSLLNGMTILAVSPEIKYISRGLVLAIAVWMDVRLARK